MADRKSKNRVLFLKPDCTAQSEMLSTSQSPIWASAFDTILEKHGYLNIDFVSIEFFKLGNNYDNYNLAFIPSLPKSSWTTGLEDFVQNFQGYCVLEGPINSLEALINLKQAEPSLLTSEPVELIIPSENSESTSKYKHHLDNLGGKVFLAPKKVDTKYQFPDQSLLRQSIYWKNPTVSANSIIVDRMNVLRKRALVNGEFFPIQNSNAIALLSFIFFLLNTREHISLKHYHSWFTNMLESSENFKKYETVNGQFPANTNETFNRVKSIIDKKFSEHSNKLASYLSLSLSGLTAKQQLALKIILIKEKSEQKKLALNYLGDTQYCYQTFKQDDKVYVENTDRNLVNVFLSTLILFKAEKEETAFLNLGLIIKYLYSPSNGSFSNILVEKEICILPQFNNDPWITLVLVNLIEETDLPHDSSRFLQQSSKSAEKKWSESPLQTAICKTVSGKCKKHWMGKTVYGESNLLYSINCRLVCNFNIFSFLVHSHTEGTLDAPYWNCNRAHSLLVESLFFDTLDKELKENGIEFIKVNPWPFGYNACLTLRHDVDRLLSESQVRAVEIVHERYSINPTWCWLGHRLDHKQLSMIAKSKQEIALHALKTESKMAEIKKLSETERFKVNVAGESFHGAGGDFWLGLPSVKAAKECNLAYTEMVPGIVNFPFTQFPVIHADYTVSTIKNIVSITHNASTDATCETRKPESGDLDIVREKLELGWYVNLLNHPDINIDKLDLWLSQLMRESTLNMSAIDVAHWWRSTHSIGNLQIDWEWTSDDTIEIVCLSNSNVNNVCLVLNSPKIKELLSQSNRAFETENVRHSCEENELLINVNLLQNTQSTFSLSLGSKELTYKRNTYDS